MNNIDIEKIKRDFYNHTKMKSSGDEDNIKINTYSFILSPIFQVNNNLGLFDSEHSYLKAGRSDGTINGLVFEYKKSNYFNSEKGIHEALYGRNNKDSGLYNYILDCMENDYIDDSIFETTGVGFDGYQWIFARFIPDSNLNTINSTKTNINSNINANYNAKFNYRRLNFEDGIKELSILIKSTNKITLSKETLLNQFRPTSAEVRESITNLYYCLLREFDDNNNRIITLYNEWNRNFGTIFSEDENSTEFNATSNSIARMYLLKAESLDSNKFLFAIQTYFNILIKLLISTFLDEIKAPLGNVYKKMNYSDIANLFEGKQPDSIISNFFDIHYYEWFTFVNIKETKLVEEIVNNILEKLFKFDMETFRIKPENVHDILQELYMEFIPEKVRHMLGEYFSPDWIVQFLLDRIGYKNKKDLIDKKIIDPTAGSGAFILQAIKRVIDSVKESHKGNNLNKKLSEKEIYKITQNIVGFDLNPISSISAKANYIMTLFSYVDVSAISKPINIPIYITDSVLAPIVYSEENNKTFLAKTSVGNFYLPKFDSFSESNIFMNALSKSVDETRNFEVFWNILVSKIKIDNSLKVTVNDIYDKLLALHRSGKDSFWPKILKNSFAPVILKQKFDYVIGNPPWIAWKSMSRSYRDGSLKVWKSYGIFEKSSYDKKTSHDDFGMAVTYVALDQYLKNNGKLMFLLPWTFLKSSKGGEGFRKFEITRNNQKIPIKVEEVNDFDNIKIFYPKHTVRTISLLLRKGSKNKYPMKNWYHWVYNGRGKIPSHKNINEVISKFKSNRLIAKPINDKDIKSPWLTMDEKQLLMSNNVLSNGKNQYYKARKGIEPAGAKGVYVLKQPKLHKTDNHLLDIVNDISRQRRQDLKKKGPHRGTIESKYVYPMLGGRNISKWKVKSVEYMIVPHDINNKYGLSEENLSKEAPLTYEWLEFYKDGLYASRVQSGKFFNPSRDPWYRLDNVGSYTFSKYKVLWKEQTKSFSAVAIGTYDISIPGSNDKLFNGNDKIIVVDSKVLMLATKTFNEALFVTGILNSPTIVNIIDAYSIGLNRGIDVLKNLNIPKFDINNKIHINIKNIAKYIQKNIDYLTKYNILENIEHKLDIEVKKLYKK
ncbi:Eco57I restriction-modification methylase domain-containing protein [Apilactobacillus timberlakei]|uniref:Eco57I restriction-modification methylase domain-containing protein n=1 Tax=Apilactobacillus timberlakei TaxID=2008380 RepID=UPI001CDD09CD|nr:N-6 DNA methylase [Apilactobacillus timberlakei]